MHRSFLGRTSMPMPPWGPSPIAVSAVLLFSVLIAARDTYVPVQLTAGFLHGTSAPQACWTIIGVGIRMAQDVGAHRKKVYSASPTIEEELWRRAFWCVFSLLLFL